MRDLLMLRRGEWVHCGSAASFARRHGVTRQAVWQAASRGGLCCGARLRFADEGASAPPPPPHGEIAVISEEGRFWPSISAAAREAGTSKSWLRTRILLGKPVRGLLYARASALPVAPSALLREVGSGRLWLSAGCAASHYGIPVQDMRRAVLAATPVRGVTFEVVDSPLPPRFI